MEGLIISGEICYLIPFSEAHLTPDYIEWLNDPENVKYSNQQFRKHTIESSREYLSSFTGSSNLFLSIFSKNSNEHLGTLTAYFTPHHNLVDLGIMIGNRSFRGQGIGYDAWFATMNYLFKTLKVRKVTGGTVRSNVGMIKIMERSGMTLEGIRLRHLVFNKVEEDVYLFGKFAE